MSSSVVLAMSGASGAIYAVRLLHVLVQAGRDVHLTISPSAQLVLNSELALEVHLDTFELSQLSGKTRDSAQRLNALLGRPGKTAVVAPLDLTGPGRVTYHHYHDLTSSIASGSSLTGGMVICPASGGTLGAIAHGTGDDLMHRAAQVHLKERRKLIVVPRETPLSTIQLDNLKKLSEAGAIVLPAMPGFYHGAHLVADLIDFVVARICDQLGVDQSLMKRWGTHS